MSQATQEQIDSAAADGDADEVAVEAIDLADDVVAATVKHHE